MLTEPMRQPKQALFHSFKMRVLSLRHISKSPYLDEWNRSDLRRMVFAIGKDAQRDVGPDMIRIY